MSRARLQNKYRSRIFLIPHRPPGYISAELVRKFEEDYRDCRGNHLGVELLDKRLHHGKVEYYVRWKGRPNSENSWEKESTISLKRIREFEAVTKSSGELHRVIHSLIRLLLVARRFGGPFVLVCK